MYETGIGWRGKLMVVLSIMILGAVAFGPASPGADRHTRDGVAPQATADVAPSMAPSVVSIPDPGPATVAPQESPQTPESSALPATPYLNESTSNRTNDPAIPQSVLVAPSVYTSPFAQNELGDTKIDASAARSRGFL